jgi:hypothetical protein
MGGGTDFSQKGCWKDLNHCNRRRPNSSEGLTGGEGKVREKVQELTAVTGMARVEEESG